MESKLKIYLLMACCIAMCVQVENHSLYGIGNRIIGDQLIVKDILQSRIDPVLRRAAIVFHYNVPEQITFIEIASEENVVAEVKFSYHDELVRGTVTAMNSTSPNFEAIIRIYGFSHTMLNVNPSLIINRDQNFQGLLEPIVYESSGTDDESNSQEVDDGDDYGDYAGLSDEQDAGEPFEQAISDAELDEFSGALDKIIELGHRQPGDYLIHETYQTSPSLDDKAGNHSVTFYYIDSNYVTYVRFTLFEYYGNKEVPDAQGAMAIYTHYSPNTLKAVISDNDTRLLFVQMRLYGFRPEDLPRDYVPYLASRNIGSFNPTVTVSPLSPLQRLKAVLKSTQEEAMALRENHNKSPSLLVNDELQSPSQTRDESETKPTPGPFCVSSAIASFGGRYLALICFAQMSAVLIGYLLIPTKV